MKEFLVSVIIPIYKVEKYLLDAVHSVMDQSIGFRDNIELVLVNDGSPDSCGEICKTLKQKFPENIVYIEKENGGVSSARNMGLEAAHGKYINFLDADDKWEEDAFEAIINFLEENADRVSIVGCKMQRFEGMTSMHKLSMLYRHGSKIVDITNPEDCYNIHVHVTSAFFRKDVIGDIRFNENMKYGEDTLFLETVVMKAGSLGLCADALHYYRRRADNSSAIQGQKTDKSYYELVPEQFYMGLIRESQKRFGYVIPYIQSCIAYDFGWRVSTELNEYELTPQEREAYFKRLREILEYIDDEIILKSIFHRKLSTKSAILNIKYGYNIIDKFEISGDEIVFKGKKISDILENKGMLFVDRLYLDGKELTVEGRFASWMEIPFPQGYLNIEYNGEKTKLQLAESNYKIDSNIFGKTSRYKTFKYKHKNASSAEIRFVYSYNGRDYDLGINYNPLFTSCEKEKYAFQFGILSKKQIFRAGRYSILIEHKKKNEIEALCRERERHIESEFPRLYELRSVIRTEKKPELWVIFGDDSKQKQFEVKAKGNKKIQLRSFKYITDRYRQAYLNADKLIVFGSDNLSEILAPFDRNQRLFNDRIHFEIFGIFDSSYNGNLDVYTPKAYTFKLGNNSVNEIDKAYEAIANHK